MVDRVAELAALGCALPAHERLRLLTLLLESLREDALVDVDAAWIAEIERRVASHEQGDCELFEVHDVMREMTGSRQLNQR
ncbi:MULTISPECIES: addiction module protein [Duganella]|uniref:addiction module protein n=1 Tax=Duganella TaxID=75654 RepID=UPI00159D4CF9